MPPLTEIPAPSLIEAAIKGVGASLSGTEPVCQFGSLTTPGVIKILQGPVHGGSVNFKVKRREGLKEWEEEQPRDRVTFAAASSVPVVRPGAAPATDTAEFPATAQRPEHESGFYTAFSKTYNVQAQNTAQGIEINASNSSFTDLIHEATHSFETNACEAPFKEGLCDLFAGMAATRLGGADKRFTFAYNPSYAPYVAAMNRLIPLIGLPALARVYFLAASPKAALTEEIRAVVPATADPAAIVAKLWCGNDRFPTDFNEGVEALQRARGGNPVALTSTTAQDEALAQHTTTYRAFLLAQAQSYDHQYGTHLAEGTEEEAASGVANWYGVSVMEARLRILYRQRAEVTGSQFVELMKLIDLHENSLIASVGGTKPALRRRVLPSVSMRFSVTRTSGPGESLFVVGDAPELGEWDETKARPLTAGPGGVWSGVIEMSATGGIVSYRYLSRAVTTTKDTTTRTRPVPVVGGEVTQSDSWS